MIRRPPRSTRTDTLFPYTTLFRSLHWEFRYPLSDSERGSFKRSSRVEPGPFTPNLPHRLRARSEEHTSELQSLMRISYAVFCLKKKKKLKRINSSHTNTHIRTTNRQTRTYISLKPNHSTTSD